MSDSVRILPRRVVTDPAGVERLLIGDTPLPEGYIEGGPRRTPLRDDAGHVQVLARSERVAPLEGEATEVITDQPPAVGGETVEVTEDEPVVAPASVPDVPVEGAVEPAPVEPASAESSDEPEVAPAPRRDSRKGQGNRS